MAEFVAGARTRHEFSLPRRLRVRRVRGDGAPKSANLWHPRSLQTTAGASRRANRSVCSASGPALVRSVAHLRADRAFSQLLAGTPSGPGGAPMPPECLVATRPAGAAPRPAFATPRESALQKDEVRAVYARFGARGLCGDTLTRESPLPLWEACVTRTGAARRSPAGRRCATDRRRHSGPRRRYGSRRAIGPTAPFRPAATR